MKIAIINHPHDTLFPPQQNAAGLWSYQVARRLSASADVTVFGRRTNDQKPIEWDGRVCYRFLRTAPVGFWQAIADFADDFRQLKKPFSSSAFSYFPYAMRVAQMVRRERFDVVHIHNSSNFVPIIRAFNPRTKIVLHMNCEWLSQLDAKLMARRIGRTDLVVGNSKYIRDTIRVAHPQFADRIRHIHSGVDTARFHPEKAPKPLGEGESAMLRATRAAMLANSNRVDETIDQTVFATVVPEPNRRAARRESKILFVGRVSPEKGVHDLITAFGQIAAHVPQSTLEIIGPAESLPKKQLIALSNDADLQDLEQFYQGEYTDYLQQMIPPYLEKRIKFVGHVSQAELIERYRNCALVVSPSYSESFGMSLAEAGACGKPVVATTTGGIPDIVVDGETGFLVERGDVYLLAQGMGILLQDFDEQLRMGRNARIRVKHLFDWNEVAKTTLMTYRHLLNGNRRVEKSIASAIRDGYV